jgi:RNA recognition motif. (a.k.a. RRM, RBD, or RNP domain)
MPDYALEHVFSRYGTVDFVRLQSNACYGVVQFATAEAAAAALAGLSGTDILGQVPCCRQCIMLPHWTMHLHMHVLAMVQACS